MFTQRTANNAKSTIATGLPVGSIVIPSAGGTSSTGTSGGTSSTVKLSLSRLLERFGSYVSLSTLALHTITPGFNALVNTVKVTSSPGAKSPIVQIPVLGS